MPIPADPYGRYRASELALSNNDPVATWADEGSGGNDLTQGTAGLRPVYKGSEAVNGHPTVKFDGDALATAAYSAALAQPNTIVAIVEWWGAFLGDGNYVCDGLTAGRHVIVTSPTLSGFWRIFAGTTVSTNIANPSLATPYFVTAVFNGASSRLEVNETASGNVSPGAQTLTGLTVGNRFSAEFDTQVHVAELLIYDRTLDAEELADLGEYVQVTYDIDLGYEVDPGEPEPEPEPTSYSPLWSWLWAMEREGAL
jgi:hypothetical protein